MHKYIQTVLLLFLLLAQSDLFAQSEDLRIPFVQYSTKDGLTQSSSLTIIQDSEGFIWTGTQGSVDRFDGYRFEEVKIESQLAINNVSHLHESQEGHIWISTLLGGLAVHDPRTLESRTFTKGMGGLATNSIWKVVESKSGIIWIVHFNGQIQRFNPENETFQQSEIEVEILVQEETGYVQNVILEGSDRVWIVGNYGTLIRHDLSPDGRVIKTWTYSVTDLINEEEIYVTSSSIGKKGSIYLGLLEGEIIKIDTREKEMSANSFSWPQLSGFAIYDIVETEDENAWVASEKGLWFWNPAKNSIQRVRNSNANALCDIISELTLDKEGLLWLGTEFCGIFRQEADRLFSEYVNGSLKTKEILGTAVWAMAEDPNENLWISTSSKLIYFYNRKDDVLHSFPIDFGAKTPTEDLLDIFLDSNQGLWIASKHGLERYQVGSKNPELNSRTKLTIPEITGPVWEFMEDRQGCLWIGTEYSGVFRYNPQTGEVTQYLGDPEQSTNLVDIPAQALFEDKKGRMWVGSFGKGLIRLDPKTSETKVYLYHPDKPEGFIDIVAGPILEDEEGYIWLGSDRGFARLDPESDDIIKFDTSNSELPDNTIYGMVFDNHNSLWISTNKGISRFSKANRKIENFTTMDGLQDLEFNYLSTLKTRDGHILMGGINGLNWFNPEDFERNFAPPSLVYTRLRVLNKQVLIGDESPIKTALPFAKEINLQPDQNIFEIEFSPRSFGQMRNFNFQYRLLGFNEEWIDNGKQRTVSFMNLAPGSYTLQVRSAVRNGDWLEYPASVGVIVEARWYQEWWASIIWFFIGGLILLSFIYIATQEQRQAFQRRELERQGLALEKEKEANVRLRELDELKSVFLANMSHEIRTPLTSVIGFASHLRDEVPEEFTEDIQYILNGGHRLMDTINSVLDLAQLEGKALKLDLESISLNEMIPIYLSIFEHRWDNSRNIKLRFVNHADGDVKVLADQGALQRILVNLVGNAFKFTSEGEILVAISKEGYLGVIEVMDTGEGIDSSYLPEIFAMFSQEYKGFQRKYEGNGLGLAISNHLSDLMNGQITVTSTKGVGSSFIVKLPLTDQISQSKKGGAQRDERIENPPALERKTI